MKPTRFEAVHGDGGKPNGFRGGTAIAAETIPPDRWSGTSTVEVRAASADDVRRKLAIALRAVADDLERNAIG